MLSEIARTISEALGFQGVAFNLYRPAWDDFIVSTVHGSDAMCETLLGETYDWSVWSAAARGPLRAARRLLHPRGQRRLVRPGARRALRARPAERPGHRRLDPRRRALRPLPALRRAPARHRLGRRAGLGHAPLRRPARPARGHGVAHRPRSAGRAGGRRGRAPPDRARAAAAGLLAPVRAPLDRRGAPGGVRRRRRRAGLPEGHDRAGRPRDRGADAACGRRLGRRLARPAVARVGRRDPAAAASRLRGRGLLPRAADGGHRAHAAAHRLHLDHERARTARVGPPLARGPALRPGRADLRAHLGRRPGRPAAALGLAPAGPARLRQPGDDGRDRCRPRRAAARPGRSRLAHRDAQPARVHARAGHRDRALPALRAPLRAGPLRPRRVQADQRHRRPPRGRPRAGGCRRPAGAHHPRQRLRLPHRRRRVRPAAARDRRRRGPRRGRADRGRAGGRQRPRRGPGHQLRRWRSSRSDGSTPEELIRRADQALYAAKRSDDDLHFAPRAA